MGGEGQRNSIALPDRVLQQRGSFQATKAGKKTPPIFSRRLSTDQRQPDSWDQACSPGRRGKTCGSIMAGFWGSPAAALEMGSWEDRSLAPWSIRGGRPAARDNTPLLLGRGCRSSQATILPLIH